MSGDSSGTKGRRGGGLGLGFLRWIALIGVPFFVIPNCISALIGHERAALEWLGECPQVTARMGTPITKNYLGWSCGSAETSGGSGDASWTLAVKGPVTTGSFRFYAEKHAGRWQLTKGSIHVDGETIDVLACLQQAGSGGPGVTRLSEDYLATIKKRCEGGDEQQCLTVGLQYLNGAGAPQDPALAEAYLKKACQVGMSHGNPGSCDTAAMLYERTNPQLARSFHQGGESSPPPGFQPARWPEEQPTVEEWREGDPPSPFEHYQSPSGLELPTRCGEPVLFSFPKGPTLGLCDDQHTRRSLGKGAYTTQNGGRVLLLVRGADATFRVVFHAIPSTRTRYRVQPIPGKGALVVEELVIFGKDNEPDRLRPFREWPIGCDEHTCAAAPRPRCVLDVPDASYPGAAEAVRRESRRDPELQRVRADWFSGNFLSQAVLLRALAGDAAAQELLSSYPVPRDCGQGCRAAYAEFQAPWEEATTSGCLQQEPRRP